MELADRVSFELTPCLHSITGGRRLIQSKDKINIIFHQFKRRFFRFGFYWL